MSASSGMSAEGASIASLAPSGSSSAETSISSMLMPCGVVGLLRCRRPRPGSAACRPRRIVVVLVLRVARALVAHFERVEQVVDRRRRSGAGSRPAVSSRSSSRAGALLDERPPQIDQLARRRRRLLPGQALAHHHGDRVLDRRVGAVGDRRRTCRDGTCRRASRRDSAPRPACAARRSPRRAPARPPRTPRAPAGRPASAAGAPPDRDRRAAARSSRRARARSRRPAADSLRGGSGSRALPPAMPGRSAA